MQMMISSISISSLLWLLLEPVLSRVSEWLFSLVSVSESVECFTGISGFRVRYANVARYSIVKGKIRSPKKMLAALGILVVVIHPTKLVLRKYTLIPIEQAPRSHETRDTILELLCGPILAWLLVNRRSGINANGSSNDKIIEAMMISFAAPEDPPIIQTTKLGAMAMHLVNRFLNQSFIFNSKKPCIMYCPA